MSEETLSIFALLLRAAESPKRKGSENDPAHNELWWRWLTLPLEQQTHEIERVLAMTGESDLLAMPELYAKVTAPEFMPEGATREERSLFTSNFEASMGLILGAAVKCALCAEPDCR